MSNLWDVADTGEHRGKGGAPKEENDCSSFLGHAANNRMTVRSARRRWRAIRITRTRLTSSEELVFLH